MVYYMDDRLTKRQYEILEKLYGKGSEIKVQTVQKDQKEISEEFGITRQALSNHLRKLKESSYIRTGRGFIDVTNKGLEALGKKGGEAMIFVKAHPPKRNEVYEAVRELPGTASRVTGELDLIMEVDRDTLEDVLSKLSKVEGIQETSTHIILKEI